jgi:hypothetical protein
LLAAIAALRSRQLALTPLLVAFGIALCAATALRRQRD